MDIGRIQQVVVYEELYPTDAEIPEENTPVIKEVVSEQIPQEAEVVFAR